MNEQEKQSGSKVIQEQEYATGDSRMAGREPSADERDLLAQKRPEAPSENHNPHSSENRNARAFFQMDVPHLPGVRNGDHLSFSIVGRRNSEASRQSNPTDSTCFVATMAFGTPWAEEVQALRAFRDETLRRYRAGRAFIAFYYRYGPAWAKAIENQPRIKQLVRQLLRGLIRIIGTARGAA